MANQMKFAPVLRCPILVLQSGKTQKGGVARAVELVTETGGKVGGGLLVCGSAEEAILAMGRAAIRGLGDNRIPKKGVFPQGYGGY